MTAKVPLPSEAAKIDRRIASFKWPWNIGSTLGLTLAVFLLPQIIIGLSLSEGVRQELADGGNTGLTFAVLVAGEIISFFFLYRILRSKKKRLKDIYLKMPKLKDLFMAVPGFGLYIVGTVVALTFASVFINEETLEQEQEIGFEAVATNQEQVLVFIVLVLLVPFIEELLFRGFVFKGLLSRMPFSWAAVLSSVIFGLAHFQLNVGIDTFVLGVVACWLVYTTKNLWPAIVLHSIKNAVAFAVLYNYIEF